MTARRGDPAVCFWGREGESLSRLHEHMPHGVTVLEGSSPAELVAAAHADCDVVLVAPDALVSAGWLEGLREAAASDSTVATASALAASTLGAGDGPPDAAARAVAAASLRLRPRIPRPDGPCVYVRRAALDLCFHGDLDEFWERCLAHGLQHVLADDVLVGGEAPALPAPLGTSLARATGAARRAVRGMTVAIDARSVGPVLSGAQIHVIELAAAVARSGSAQVKVVVSDAAGEEARSLLERIEGAEVVPEGSPGERCDVVHRPHQLGSLEDLIALRELGERLVVTQQDLIAYRNPAYHPLPDSWRLHRRVTRLSLAAADAVVFSSRHALGDALADDLVDERRAHVLPIGTERVLAAESVAPSRPEGVDDGPFLLQLGNDFLHKNRAWAIGLLDELRTRGWEGGLVLAGPQAAHGSSAEEEDGAPGVVRLGAVSEAEKAWLYGACTAVLYPTTYEGFGLVPFEAATAGVPCLFAPVASLAETLPEDAAVLVPWDAEQSAEAALPLLAEGAERERHVELLRSAAAALPGWDEHAAALLEVYEEAARSPYRETTAVVWDSLRAEQELAGWHELRIELGDDGFNLVRPGGHLDTDQQKALLSVLTRERLRGPFLKALEGFYRLGYRARRRGG